MISFDAGARAESDKYSPGIAHMLEHMIFKGTEKRTSNDIAMHVARLGGASNAFTSMEQVLYYITVPYEDIEQAIEILDDMVFGSVFPEDEFGKEREVVMEECLSAKDSVMSDMYDQYTSSFYKDRFAVPIIGTVESINGFTTEELKRFYNEFYDKKDAIISLTGNFTKQKAGALLRKYFGKASGKIKNKAVLYKPEYQDSFEVKFTRQQLEHNYLWMVYPGLSTEMTARQEAAVNILEGILVDGMDSRLFMEVREKRGLVYSIGGHTDSYRDYSSTIIHCSAREENIPEIIRTVESEISRVKEELVSDEELLRSKNKLKAQTYALYENAGSLARNLISRTITGAVSVDDLCKEIPEVTAEEVRDIAKILFDDTKKMTLLCSEGDKNAA
jgi:predicted Zn-dependent peptidase